MHNQLTKLTLAILVFVSMGCQKQAEIDGSLMNDQEPTNTTIVNNLCSDGTLDCVVSGNPYTSTSSIITQLYNQCISGCTADGGDATSCQNLCDDINDTPADTWASDELHIPDNAKAIEVEIKLCVDSYVHNTIILQGPTVSVAHYRTPQSQMMGNPVSLKAGSRGAPVGQNLKCKVDGLYNKAKVTFTPVTSTSVKINDIPQKVVPFTYSATIEKKYGSPHVASFGIPKVLRDEINLEHNAWVASKAVTSLNTAVPVKFQYLNNDMGAGTSFLHIIPPMHWAPMTFKFVLFAEAKNN